MLDDIVSWTAGAGWWGLENLSAIPGTVGATPVQNVGAYGVEVSALTVEVSAINVSTLEEKIFSKEECNFSYRDSYFKTQEGKCWVITEVVFLLSTGSNPNVSYSDLSRLVSGNLDLTPLTVREEIISIRSKKFPDWSKVGTAGSFFKNPIISPGHFQTLKQAYTELPGFVQQNGDFKVSLGFILDKVCGLRGYCEGSICLFEKQALVLVVQKGATAHEVKEFVRKVSEIVFQKTNIQIECEVQFV